MLPVIAKVDLFNACKVLFGPYNKISMDFLRYLEPSLLKAVYRKKALETHLDRSRHFEELKLKRTNAS